MQTVKRMSYSNSMHFSDKLSYKILFISSYGLKDMIYARFKYLQEFSEIKTEIGLVETAPDLSLKGDGK
jgi:hypothetical protein